MRSALLPALARFGGRHHRAIFVGALLAVVLSLGLASRLTLDTDMLNLLPQDEPAVRTFRQSLEEFGSLDFLLVVVRIPDGAVVDPYEAYVDKLGGRLSDLPAMGEVEYHIGEIEELVATFFPQALFFLDAAGREAVARRLTDAALEARASEIRRLLATPQSLALKSLVKLDPLGLSGVFLDRLGSSPAGLAIDWTSGYFLSRDHRMLLLLAKPVRPPQDIAFSRGLVEKVQGEVEALAASWPQIAGEDGGAPPEVELAGRYLVALGDESVIRQDVLLNAVTSMAGVLLLFLFAFRRLSTLMYAFVPLCCGLALTFGFSSLALGSLNQATSGVAALLIGLGIDFVIVSYGRFVEERRGGADLDGALAAMSGSSGRAVVLGAVTSAATFYAFSVTEFTGLREMGYLTGTGILLCMVSVLLLLPAMLAWGEEHHRRRDSEPRLFLHGFGSGHLIRWSLRRPWTVLAAGLALTVVAAGLSLRLHFDDSVSSMRPPDTRSVALRDEVSQRFGSGFDAMMIVVSGDSADEVVERVGAATAGAAELQREGVLSGYDSLSALIPPRASQDEALAWLAAERGSRLDMKRVRATFNAALAREGLRVEPLAAGLDLVEAALGPTKPIAVADLERSPAGHRLLARYLLSNAGGWTSVVYLYPPPGSWRRGPPPQAEALAERLGPHAVLTGANVVSQFLRRQVLKDAILAGILGFVLVGILLWLDYRRLGDTLLSLAPLLVGILWMLGGMVLLGIPMNFMNIFVSTMIIGIGVDYGIHMIHRYRERGAGAGDAGRLLQGLEETGKAIVMAALSTVVGFGSLSMSHYPGLQSMGKVAILGALATCLVAVTLLPAYFGLRLRRAGRGREGPGAAARGSGGGV